ncbi:hypothetical protein [Asticcacaulis sp. YBE204]|uniref:hypothetical protein n=1 Tax=Asticcacaulis sp. YBE204 TaxID=1282363 RepID=UPI0003C3D540|nr:hypothetical protein [Asticcacaulis sp. YBE204]ESQ80428.1 hypothetical protein AEYBE204_03955 [Asticcacaulis sp. YBE204]
MNAKIITVTGLAVLSLAACDSNRVVAPKDRGVCYQVAFPKDQKPKFNVVKRDLPSIEYCAAHLDKVRIDFMKLGSPRKELVGSFQGTFLFVDARGVKIGQTFEGPRFQLLAKAPDGRLLVPGAFEQEKPDFSDVQTLPDNLPQKK